MTRAPTRAERQAALAMAAQGAAKAPVPPAVPDAPREPTATERLRALAEQRRAGGGLLIPPPSTVTIDSVRKWLAAVADVGGPGDVEIAWHRVQDRAFKERLRNEYDALRATAGQRHGELHEAARKEAMAEEAAARRRRAKSEAQAELARAEREVVVKRQQLAAMG